MIGMVFPAKIEFSPGEKTTKLKVWPITGGFQVWGLVDRQPKLIASFQGEVTQTGKSWRAIGTDETGAAVEWLIEKDSGCGCGHQLKNFRPPGAAKVGT